MGEKRLTEQNYKKILDGVMEQAEKDFGEVVVENMFDEAVIDTLKEMAIKHSNDSYVYRVLVNAINLIQDLKAKNESFGETINQSSETLKKQKAEIERLTEENKKLVKEIDLEVELQTKRKRQIITESQEFIDELANKNAELQKKVDELTKRNFELAEKGEKVCIAYKQAVKDTAKEIFTEIKEDFVFNFKGNEDYKKGFCDALEQYDKQLRDLAKQKGL